MANSAIQGTSYGVATESQRGVVNGTDARNLVFGGSALSFRNKIINGAMVIDQRNAGAKVQQDSKFGVDRFVQYISGNFFTAGLQQKSDTPPAGFGYYLRMSADTAGTATTGQYAFLTHRIEGYNVADLSWGTSSASAVMLSFWVRSSLTGSFGGSLVNSSDTRSYCFTFNISAANTWEYKTISIPGCTDGTWLKDNGIGIKLNFDYGSGSSLRTTANSWVSGGFTGVTGTVSICQTLNATLDITGVQLERSSGVATPFENRPIGTELALCQRYYQILELNGTPVALYPTTSTAYFAQVFSEMRTTPSGVGTGIIFDTTFANAGYVYYHDGAVPVNVACTYSTNVAATNRSISMIASRNSGTFLTTNYGAHTYIRIKLSAEL